jgi:hypothetical protein
VMRGPEAFLELEFCNQCRFVSVLCCEIRQFCDHTDLSEATAANLHTPLIRSANGFYRFNTEKRCPQP